MAQMNLPTEQKMTARQREQIYPCKGGGGRRDVLGVWGWWMQTIPFRMGEQQGPDVQHESESDSLSRFNSFQPHGLYPTRLFHPWDFPGKSTGVGCYFLLQGIFPTQGSNLGLLHCRQTLYHLSHQLVWHSRSIQ